MSHHVHTIHNLLNKLHERIDGQSFGEIETYLWRCVSWTRRVRPWISTYPDLVRTAICWTVWIWIYHLRRTYWRIHESTWLSIYLFLIFFAGFSFPFWIWRDPLRVSVTLSFWVKNRHTHIYFCERWRQFFRTPVSPVSSCVRMFGYMLYWRILELSGFFF